MKKRIIVIGAGPAGLAAAYEFVRQKKMKDFDIHIIEQDTQVGGISKTLSFKGYRFDLGGHRFYTKFKEINEFYETFLGKDMLERKRLSRIYYEKKFYNYPLSAVNVLKNLGLLRAIKIFSSWLERQTKRHKTEKTFDKWVENRFGDKLFQMFFKTYTEKVWGIPTNKLSADWAAQRIQNFDLLKALVHAVFRINTGAKTIIGKFYYPKYGPGMLYESMKSKIEKAGITIQLNQKVTGLKKKGREVTEIKIKNLKTGKTNALKADYIISTMPFDELTKLLNPPAEIKKQLNGLKFRNFITVNLVVKSNPFPDQWIYVHEPKVKVGRIQNFRNWSPYMVKRGENNTPIGMEYFANEHDKLWNMSDDALVKLAKKEIHEVGLVKKQDIIGGFVYRVKNAYPIYNFNYQEPLELTKAFINKFTNIHLCGRGGLFRYNNQDHSILTGFYAARNIINGNRELNVWDINNEDEYLEKK